MGGRFVRAGKGEGHRGDKLLDPPLEAVVEVLPHQAHGESGGIPSASGAERAAGVLQEGRHCASGLRIAWLWRRCPSGELLFISTSPRSSQGKQGHTRSGVAALGTPAWLPHRAKVRSNGACSGERGGL